MRTKGVAQVVDGRVAEAWSLALTQQPQLGSFF
jgi:hypothetical protein